MSDEREALIARAFLRWDVDGNGRINRFEFQGLVEELAPERGPDASAAYDEMDTDDDKRITYDEFFRWWDALNPEEPMTSFSVSATFSATPDALYDAWVDGEQHWEMTGAEAKSDPRVGGQHSAWEGYISGEFVELEPGKRIVQTWRTAEFPEGAFSRVEISFGAKNGETEVTIRHSDIPDGQPDYKQGWWDHYFTPMKAHFG